VAQATPRQDSLKLIDAHEGTEVILSIVFIDTYRNSTCKNYPRCIITKELNPKTSEAETGDEPALLRRQLRCSSKARPR